MQEQDADLNQMNQRLGGAAKEFLKDPKCHLIFEGTGEVNRAKKQRKPCLIYVLPTVVLLCRPRKIGKKYYIKYQVPISTTKITIDIAPNTQFGIESHPIQLITTKGKSTVTILLWLPSLALIKAFVDIFEDAKQLLIQEDYQPPYWKPLSTPVTFSYDRLLQQVFSTVTIENAGRVECNGMYFAVGSLNGAFMWKNQNEVYLSREYLCNSYGWIIGNLADVYYTCRTDSMFPTPADLWRAVTNEYPCPSLMMHEIEESESIRYLRNHVLNNSYKAPNAQESIAPKYVIKALCNELIHSEQLFLLTIGHVLEPYQKGLQQFIQMTGGGGDDDNESDASSVISNFSYASSVSLSLSMSMDDDSRHIIPSHVASRGGRKVPPASIGMGASSNIPMHSSQSPAIVSLGQSIDNAMNERNNIRRSSIRMSSPTTMSTSLDSDARNRGGIRSASPMTPPLPPQSGSSLSHSQSPLHLGASPLPNSVPPISPPIGSVLPSGDVLSIKMPQRREQSTPSAGASASRMSSASIENAMFDEAPMLNEESIQDVFYNIQDIKGIGRSLVTTVSLMNAQDDPRKIVNALVALVTKFEEYNKYIKHLPEALATVRRLSQINRFTDFIQAAMESVDIRGRRLDTSLYLPLERVLHYERFVLSLMEFVPRASALFTGCTELLKVLTPICDSCRNVLYEVRRPPPIEQALSLAIPLGILGDHDNQFYCIYDCCIGEETDVAECGKSLCIPGRLYVFMHYCIFAIPNPWMKASFISVLFFDHYLLKVEPLIEEGITALSMEILNEAQGLSDGLRFILCFDSESDKMACERTIAEIHRQIGDINQEMNRALVLEPDLEEALSPITSPFANLQDSLAMERLQIYREFLATEYAFINDLFAVLDAYKAPILKAVDKRTLSLTLNDVDIMFNNIDSIASLHNTFLSSIRSHVLDTRLSTLLSQEFKLLCVDLKSKYHDYCKGFYKSLELIQKLTDSDPEFDNTLSYLTRDPRCRGLDLPSYLIKPIQRICKYPLFFNRLLSNMSKTDAQRPVVQEASDVVVSIVSQINDRMNEAERYNQVFAIFSNMVPPQKELIVSSRVFQSEIKVKVSTNGKSKRELSLLIFSDILVFVKEIRGLLFSKSKYSFRELIYWSDYILVPPVNSTSLTFCVNKKSLLLAPSSADRVIQPSGLDYEIEMSSIRELNHTLSIIQSIVAPKSNYGTLRRQERVSERIQQDSIKKAQEFLSQLDGADEVLIHLDQNSEGKSGSEEFSGNGSRRSSTSESTSVNRLSIGTSNVPKPTPPPSVKQPTPSHAKAAASPSKSFLKRAFFR